MKRSLVGWVLGVVLVSSSLSAQAPEPKGGYLPDEKTAVAVGEAILIPIYGERQIASECPPHGRLDKGVWTVSGTLDPHCGVGGRP